MPFFRPVEDIQRQTAIYTMSYAETLYYRVQGIIYGDNVGDTTLTQEGNDYIDFETACEKYNMVIRLNQFSERPYEVIILEKVLLPDNEAHCLMSHIVELEEYVCE